MPLIQWFITMITRCVSFMHIIYTLLEGEREHWYLNKKMDFG